MVRLSWSLGSLLSRVLYIKVTHSGVISGKVIGIKWKHLISTITVTSGRFSPQKDFCAWTVAVKLFSLSRWGLRENSASCCACLRIKAVSTWNTGRNGLHNDAKPPDIIIAQERKDFLKSNMWFLYLISANVPISVTVSYDIVVSKIKRGKK